jgi:hypothetical protein
MPKVEAICPHCQALFAQAPTRKTACRSCGGTVYVRSTQALLPRTLVTADEAAVLDNLRRAEADGGPLHQTVLQHLPAAGSLGAAFEAVTRAQGHWYLHALYLAQTGRDTADALILHHRQQLEAAHARWGEAQVTVTITPAGNACSACQAVQGFSWTLAEALALQLLPCVACTRPLRPGWAPFCRCAYRIQAGLPRLSVEAIGGPRDGERFDLVDLRALVIDGDLYGYVPANGPEPTEDGTYVVTPDLRLEWDPRDAWE